MRAMRGIWIVGNFTAYHDAEGFLCVDHSSGWRTSQRPSDMAFHGYPLSTWNRKDGNALIIDIWSYHAPTTRVDRDSVS